MRKNKRKLNPNKVAIISSIMALIGLYLFSYNFIVENRQEAYNYMSARIFHERADEIVSVTVNYETEDDTEEIIVTNDFIGFLEIPRISFNRGFLHRDAEYNDVEKNLYVVETSTMPNVENGNLIIAAHSGTGWRAFFRYLHLLELRDLAHITYNGVRYTYQVVDIYEEPKIGTVQIFRNPNINTLTLITCTENSNTLQTIYILERISSAQI